MESKKTFLNVSMKTVCLYTDDTNTAEEVGEIVNVGKKELLE